MAADPRIRASDADRDRVAEALREHHAAGRLTMEEFQERLDRVYAAKTLGDLDQLMNDLPAIDLYQLPIPESQRPAQPPQPRPAQHGRLSPVWQAAWASWASVTAVLIVIWVLAGGGYFWPAWVFAPWGALMGVRWLMGAHPGGHGDRRSQRHEWRHEMRDRRHEMRAHRSGMRRDLRENGAGDARARLPWDPPRSGE